MDSEIILQLLSNHRHPEAPVRPTPLTKHQLVLLLRSSISPNQSTDGLQSEVQETLSELQAQGEVLAGTGSRYCTAPPTVLALERENLSELLFRGDRAYLTLAHRALKTEQSENNLRLCSKMQGFNRIRDCLSQVGIRLLTVADSIEHLPYPCQVSKVLLRSPWSENPFTMSHWSKKGSIQHYVSKRDMSQKERWLPLSFQQLQNRTMLQLPTGEYLWFQDQAFYELEPDAALLAMFHQDKETGYPLKLVWDKPQGRLNLQGTILPSAYAQWLWRLSEPDSDRYRTRKIQPLNHPLVETAFQRLGCLLV